MDKVIKYTRHAVLLTVMLISFCIFCVVFLYNIEAISKTKIVLAYFDYLFILALSFLSAGMIGLKIKNKKIFLPFLFLLGFAIRLIWILVVKTSPISDFKLMYDASVNVINGNIDSIKANQYLQVWAYQMGHVLYQAFILKILGNSLVALKIANAIISSLIPVVIFLTVDKISNFTSAKLSSLLYCFYISSIASTSILTNQHVSTLLFYICLYLALNAPNKKYSFVLIGVLLAIGNVIRPEAPIILIAILVYMFFYNASLENGLKNYLKNNVLKALAIVVIYVVAMNTFSYLLVSSKLSDYGFVNRDPLWKLTLGLDAEHKGIYNSTAYNIISKLKIGEERNKYERDLLKERLKHPRRLLVLFNTKTKYMWAGEDKFFLFVFTSIPITQAIDNVFVFIEKIQFFIFALLMLASSVFLYKDRKFSSPHFLYIILFIGMFSIYLLIEIQTRYRYVMIPGFCIISSYAVARIGDYVNKFLKKGESN